MIRDDENSLEVNQTNFSAPQRGKNSEGDKAWAKILIFTGNQSEYGSCMMKIPGKQLALGWVHGRAAHVKMPVKLRDQDVHGCFFRGLTHM